MTARLHVDGMALAAGETFALPHEAAHHALRVLRLKRGDAVVLFDGRGGEWHATLGVDHDAQDAFGAVAAQFDCVEVDAQTGDTLLDQLTGC